MRAILQRVGNASVRIDGQLHSEISEGILLLVGVSDEDTEEDILWVVKKVLNMRIFHDEYGKMNHSLLDTGGELLVVSQFTLFASTKKGNRPSFTTAARPEVAIPLYNKTVDMFNRFINSEVKTGVFGADMKISLTNDGPVTISLDSKNKA